VSRDFEFGTNVRCEGSTVRARMRLIFYLFSWFFVSAQRTNAAETSRPHLMSRCVLCAHLLPQNGFSVYVKLAQGCSLSSLVRYFLPISSKQEFIFLTKCLLKFYVFNRRFDAMRFGKKFKLCIRDLAQLEADFCV